MSWRTDLEHYESETILTLQIAERFLQEYFGHGAVRAEQILTRYFEIKQPWIDERYVQSEQSWRMATAAHFLVEVGGSPSDLPEWRVKQGYLRTPPEALEYLRTHYWSRQDQIAAVRDLPTGVVEHAAATSRREKSANLDELHREHFSFAEREDFIRIWRQIAENLGRPPDELELDLDRPLSEMVPPAKDVDSAEAAGLIDVMYWEMSHSAELPENCTVRQLVEAILRNPISAEEVRRNERRFYLWATVLVAALAAAVFFAI